MTRLVCFIDKNGQYGTCIRDDDVPCEQCEYNEEITMKNNLKDVYEKFKHLDSILSNLSGDDPIHKVACELWIAIKNELTRYEID